MHAWRVAPRTGLGAHFQNTFNWERLHTGLHGQSTLQLNLGSLSLRGRLIKKYHINTMALSSGELPTHSYNSLLMDAVVMMRASAARETRTRFPS